MSEHLIRLRKAWTAQALEGGSDAPWTLDLPTVLNTHSGPLRLTRRFQKPRIDPESEAVLLRLGQIAGLRSATLNGREIAILTTRIEHVEMPVTHLLQDRNTLELVVEVSALTRPAESLRAWGEIALVITSR